MKIIGLVVCDCGAPIAPGHAIAAKVNGDEEIVCFDCAAKIARNVIASPKATEESRHNAIKILGIIAAQEVFPQPSPKKSDLN